MEWKHFTIKFEWGFPDCGFEIDCETSLENVIAIMKTANKDVADMHRMWQTIINYDDYDGEILR